MRQDWRFRVLKALEKTGLWQKRCAHCMTPFSPHDLPRPEFLGTEALCPLCQKALQPYYGERCAACGIPLGMENAFQPLPGLNKNRLLCPECAQSPPAWQHIAYYGLYSGPLRDLILRLKFKSQLHLRHILGEYLLLASVCLPAPDLVVAIPQYPTQLGKRGFNQALELARTLCRLSGLRLHKTCLRRIRAGKPQEALGQLERKQNLRGAFQATDEVANKSIWLIDDVMTTGSTLNEASKSLLGAGARKVSTLFVARTPLGSF